MGRKGPRVNRRAQRNQANLDRSWMVWADCWICGGDFCVNNYSDHKVRAKRHELGGKLLCFRCRYGNAWARRFIQMYLLTKQTAKATCFSTVHSIKEDEACKGPVCVARRLLEEIEGERARRRLYRKARPAGESQEV